MATPETRLMTRWSSISSISENCMSILFIMHIQDMVDLVETLDMIIHGELKPKKAKEADRDSNITERQRRVKADLCKRS